MKKILIILFFFPSLVHGQVYKLRAYQTKLAEWNGVDYIKKEVNNVDILVVVNLDKDRIQTYGKVEGDFDIIQRVRQDNDDDGGITSEYKAIDQKGTKVQITLFIYGPAQRKQNEQFGGIGNMGVLYGDTLLLYYLKKND